MFHCSADAATKFLSKLIFLWFNFQKHHQARLQRLKNHGYEPGSFSRAFYGRVSVAGSANGEKRGEFSIFFSQKCAKVFGLSSVSMLVEEAFGRV